MSDTDAEQALPRIAVLGGGGFIGSQLVLNLLHLGYPLHLLINRRDPGFVSARGLITAFQGSIEDGAALAECFRGCEIVCHLVGIIAETRDKTFRKTVAEGTATVVEAAKKTGVKKIIYLSALGAAAEAPSLYHRTKWQAEEHVRNCGLDYIILKPSVVYGPNDKFINLLVGMIKKAPMIPVIGDGKYRLQPVYVDELAAIMVLAAQNESAVGKTYEIGGPERLTYLELLDIIKRVINVRRMNFHIPVFLARIMAWVLERFLKPAPLTVDQINMMAAGSTCDQTVIEKEFGIKFSAFEEKLLTYMGNRDGRRTAV